MGRSQDANCRSGSTSIQVVGQVPPKHLQEKKRRCRRCAEMGVNLDGLKNAGPGSFLCPSLAIQITPFSVQQPGPGRPDVFSQSASSSWLGGFTSECSE